MTPLADPGLLGLLGLALSIVAATVLATLALSPEEYDPR